MTTIWTYVLLVVGFVLLIKGADFFVEGSSGIAKKLKVPSLIIGLTIVAMGTSLPECAVSVAASISGNNALAVSNVVGSNIFNLMVVCGFCAVITPLAVGKRTLKQEFPFSVLMAALLLVLGYIGMSVGRIDGVILLIFFALFMFWMVHSALKARTAGITTDASEEADEIERAKPIPVWLCLVYIVGGAAAIAFGKAIGYQDARARHGSRQCVCYCSSIRVEPEFNRAYDSSNGNVITGAGNLYCGSP